MTGYSTKSRGPPTMQFEGTGDKTEKFSLWKQRIDIYSQVTDIKNEALVPHILQGLDDEGLKIYNSFTLTDAQKKSPQAIFEKFEERLKINKPNFRAARLDLHFYYQKKEETLDDFYTRCKQKTSECKFSDDEEKERIIEQLLASTPITDYRKWLLDQKEDVTIQTVLETGRQHEVTLNSIQHINDRSSNVATASTNIDGIRKKKTMAKRKSLDA